MRMHITHYCPRFFLPKKLRKDMTPEEKKMHVEVRVCLGFIISYLYNKLPRLRINRFAEEFEKAMTEKFLGHWYPDKPLKGSGYRCLKIDPGDPILEKAAVQSGVSIYDVLQYLPMETAIWVDPGEVSYRIGERGPIKVLFTELQELLEEYAADEEVSKTLDSDAESFLPASGYCTYYGAYLYATDEYCPYGCPYQPLSPYFCCCCGSGDPAAHPYGSPHSPPPAFFPRNTTPLTFTTATFAQTKFGSTKLKNNGKRANRMSPTEFANYIKQKIVHQQMQQQMHPHLQHQMHQLMHLPQDNTMMGGVVAPNFQNYQTQQYDNYYYPQAPTNFQPQYGQQNFYDNSQYMPEMYNNYAGWEYYQPNQYLPPQQFQQSVPYNRNPNYVYPQQDNRQFHDARNNYGPKRSNFYKH